MIMNSKIPGLHHVTAIASDPQRNLDFYGNIFGRRFISSDGSALSGDATKPAVRSRLDRSGNTRSNYPDV
jgi:catechol 2,3-dioxygenase-like lactoylglutathione lyase family enzyme